MCPDFYTHNKLTIKDTFPILVIDDLLDELVVPTTTSHLFFVKMEGGPI